MTLPKITPGSHLANLFSACEVMCVHDCCGIDAFVFSPLNIAAYLSTFAEKLRSREIDTINEELKVLVSAALSLVPDEDGLVCSIAKTNQYFSAQSISELAKQISWAMSVAPSVLAHSDELLRAYVETSR
ncbi:DUF6331 family protein [Duganella caerulea]|uniref:DUF6331 family protein n=1 Tax=Duganella caerulea TaxID=2885762 RepID=UPI004037C752